MLWEGGMGNIFYPGVRQHKPKAHKNREVGGGNYFFFARVSREISMTVWSSFSVNGFRI
jgi:hypothetical protein